MSQYFIIIIIVITIQSTIGTHITDYDCDSIDCLGKNYTCEENKPCYIDCGDDGCHDSIWYCPTNSDCYFTCSEYESCYGVTIFGPYNSTHRSCGNTLNITGTYNYGIKNMTVYAQYTEFVNIWTDNSVYVYDGLYVDHRYGKRLIISDDGGSQSKSFSNLEIYGPNNGTMWFNMLGDSGSTSYAIKDSFIYCNEAINVTFTCAEDACENLLIDCKDITGRLKFEIYGEYALTDSRIYCPDDGSENSYPVVNGTQNCYVNSYGEPYGVDNVTFYAVEGLNDLYFTTTADDGLSFYDDVWVFCSSNYDKDEPCGIVPSYDFSTGVISYICDYNDTKYENSTDYCQNYCDYCDTDIIDDIKDAITNSDIGFISWIQNNDNMPWVLVSFFGSMILCCLLCYCNRNQIKIDYARYKRRKNAQKLEELEKETAALNAEHGFDTDTDK